MENITVGMAFLAGVLSFFSPCILPIAPGYLGIISGTSLANLQSGSFSKAKILMTTGAFVLGFTTVFVLMGLAGSYLGQLFRFNRVAISRVGGILVIILGLHLAGWLPITWLYRTRKMEMGRSVGLPGAFLTGLVFSFGWTPCVGPVLASILTLAGSQGDVGKGLLLLVVYSLGLAIPFLGLAVAFEHVSRGLVRIKPYLGYLEKASGLLLILMGLLLLTGNFGMLSGWFG